MGERAIRECRNCRGTLTLTINACINEVQKEDCLDWRASCAGKELYLIPGIDMLNHSTRPEDVNTTLQRRTETVSKHSSSHADSMNFSGFFAIEAGESVHPLMPFF